MGRNFSRILSNPDFGSILWNTIYLTGSVVLVGFVFGMLFALLLEVIFVLNIFGHVFVVTSGGPGIRTTNLPYQVFLEAFSSFNIGRASAYGIFAIILANIAMIFFLQAVRRHRLEGTP